MIDPGTSLSRYLHSIDWRIRIGVLKITEKGVLDHEVRMSAILRKRGYFFFFYQIFAKMRKGDYFGGHLRMVFGLQED